METFKIIIDNLPETSWMETYIPILIAIIAVVISLYSAYLSRKSFSLSTRPYVWASSYGVIDQNNKSIIPVPASLGYRVINSPTQVLKNEVIISLGDKEIFSHKECNFVRFPDGTSEWSFSIGKDDYDSIIEQYECSEESLVRTVDIIYKSLNGAEKYCYSLKQEFIMKDNQWIDTLSQAT